MGLRAACRHPVTHAVAVADSHAQAWAMHFPWLGSREVAELNDFDAALEGFVTGEGLFVSRQEALGIALATKQAQLGCGICRDANGAGLISEQLAA